MAKTNRVRLEYTRKVTQTEKGFVEVDVDPKATLADVYRAAFDKDFATYLPTSYEVHNQEWDFNIKERRKKNA